MPLGGNPALRVPPLRCRWHPQCPHWWRQRVCRPGRGRPPVRAQGGTTLAHGRDGTEEGIRVGKLPWEASVVRPRKRSWHGWWGVNGMLYVRQAGTSPPRVSRIAPIALVLAVGAFRQRQQGHARQAAG